MLFEIIINKYIYNKRRNKQLAEVYVYTNQKMSACERMQSVCFMLPWVSEAPKCFKYLKASEIPLKHAIMVKTVKRVCNN